MILSRRSLLRASAASLAPIGAVACGREASAPYGPSVSSLKLVSDPAGLLDLPAGFSYSVVSRSGQRMNDGLVMPQRRDGMGLIPVAGDPDRCILMCNHEIGADADQFEAGAFAANPQLLTSLDPRLVYDRGHDGRPLSGGVTRMVYNLRTKQMESANLALAGTAFNCSGGVTPWGSWLTCEETELGPSPLNEKAHGYVFEAPSMANGLVEPVPLKAMGRFTHEAVAIDPATGVAYLTEDRREAAFYRFLPAAPGEFAKGGRLQALALAVQPGADTRNWPADKGGDVAQTIRPGQRLSVRWIDLEHVDSPDVDLMERAHAKGAAMFARCEGAVFQVQEGVPSVSFTATAGGPATSGQVWRYVPSEYEGTADEARQPGVLELLFESTGPGQFDRGDGITALPGGGLVICEDGDGDQFVRGLTSGGLIFPIARNAQGGSEFSGACFSPDGGTMFVNVQEPGVTYAITGPWKRLVREAALAV